MAALSLVQDNFNRYLRKLTLLVSKKGKPRPIVPLGWQAGRENILLRVMDGIAQIEKFFYIGKILECRDSCWQDDKSTEVTQL